METPIQQTQPPVVSQPQAAGTYQPIGVPAVEPRRPGMGLGIWGLVCAVVSLLFLPPVFGIIGIILGSLAAKKGEKILGITVIILSAIFMLVGMGFSVYVHTHPELFGSSSSVSGAVIESMTH